MFFSFSSTSRLIAFFHIILLRRHSILKLSIVVILGFLRCLSSLCRLFITLALHFLLVTKVSFVNRLPLLCLFSHPLCLGLCFSLLLFTFALLIPSAVSHLGFLVVVRLASPATHAAPFLLSHCEVVFATVLVSIDSIIDEVFLSIVGLNHDLYISCESVGYYS